MVEGIKKMKKIKISLGLCIAAIMMFSFTVTSFAATESGKYPTRRGVILVTPDKYKGLIPTGHAAIVWSKNKVIESLSDGVGEHKNNWKSNKKKIYGVTVSCTTLAQDKKAAQWCKNQIGKPYNWNYLNVSTRNSFYCSQLVWAAYKDNFNIDLNTSSYGKAVHPMELVNSSRTSTIYTYAK